MTGQMRDLHPAGNEEAGVVRQALQIAFARGAVPAQEGVAIRALPGRRAEQGAGHRAFVPIPHQVAEVLADRVALPQVVLMGEQAVEQPRVRRARRNDAHAQRAQIAKGIAHRLLGRRHRFDPPIPVCVGRWRTPRGQVQMSGPLQFQQQRARRHVFGVALGVAPVPARAQFTAQARAVPVGLLGKLTAQPLDVRGFDLSPLHDHDACHAHTVRQTPRLSPAPKNFNFFSACVSGGGSKLRFELRTGANSYTVTHAAGGSVRRKTP